MVYGHKEHIVDGIKKCCLWIKDWTYTPEHSQVCYQIESGPEVCYEGDDYVLTFEDSGNGSGQITLHIRYSRANWGNFFVEQYSSLYVDNFWKIGGWTYINGGYWAFKIFSGNFPSGYDLVFLENSTNPVVPLGYNNAQFNGYPIVPKYTLRIYNQGQQVTEVSSVNPISAWLEAIEEKCEKDPEWSLVTCWEQRVLDRLIIKTYKDNILFTLLQRKGIEPYDKIDLRDPNKIPSIFDISLIARLRRHLDCKLFPDYKIVCEPHPFYNRPNPECNKRCPEGYYLDKKDCVCKPNPCPEGYYREDDTGKCIKKPKKPKKPPPPIPPPNCEKCPPQTVYQCDSGDYICCYDECWTVLKIIQKKKGC